MQSELTDKINDMQDIYRFQVAHKFEDGEILQRVVSVRGSEETGYLASSEEWFVAEGKTLSEFYDVRFETTIHLSMNAAFMDAITDTITEAQDAGYILDCEMIDGNVIVKLGAGISIAISQPEPLAQPEPQKPTLNPEEFEITDGYVGSFGKTYTRATEESLTTAIIAAAERNKTTVDEITEKLLAGQSVEWCDSPNYYYDHAVGIIRRKRHPQAIALVKCDCGHSVPKSQVMSASSGTSCPDCYDRMSG